MQVRSTPPSITQNILSNLIFTLLLLLLVLNLNLTIANISTFKIHLCDFVPLIVIHACSESGSDPCKHLYIGTTLGVVDITTTAVSEAVTTAPDSNSRSSSSCAALGWNYNWGKTEVCGSSLATCNYASSHLEANQLCVGAGGRLCTSTELGSCVKSLPFEPLPLESLPLEPLPLDLPVYKMARCAVSMFTIPGYGAYMVNSFP